MILLLSLNLNGCFGTPTRDTRNINDQKIVGQASNIVAAKILKGGVDNNKNFVFSPFGFGTILQMLSEGIVNDNNDITTLLKHPDNRQTVRNAYKNVIEYFQGNSPNVVPQFRTWFYIYKNNSVDEEYKNLLAKNYFVMVKEIERDSFYNANEGEIVSPSSSSSSQTDTKDSILKSSGSTEKNTTVSPVTNTPIPNNNTNNSKDVADFDALKAESEPIDETRIDDQKDASKFDEVVEDRQYVEVPDIKKEIQLEISDNDSKVADEKVVNNLSGAEKQMLSSAKTSTADRDGTLSVIDEPEKFSLPLKQFEEMEIMQAQESRLAKAFGGVGEGDGTSIISGNSIVGEKDKPTENDVNKYESKMMLFNGLYYHGNWAIPFQVIIF